MSITSTPVERTPDITAYFIMSFEVLGSVAIATLFPFSSHEPMAFPSLKASSEFMSSLDIPRTPLVPKSLILPLRAGLSSHPHARHPGSGRYSRTLCCPSEPHSPPRQSRRRLWNFQHTLRASLRHYRI